MKKVEVTEHAPFGTEERADLPVYTLGINAATPILITVSVQGQMLEMEVDTGSAVSIISDKTWQSHFPDIELEESNLTLTTYT